MYSWDVGHLAALTGFLPGESCSERVSAMVYPLRDCLVVCSMLTYQIDRKTNEAGVRCEKQVCYSPPGSLLTSSWGGY